jgi:hypothetical protein
MIGYKRVDAKGGYRYLKDGKFISINKVPIDVLESFTAEDNKQEKMVTQEAFVNNGLTPKSCVFCGAFTNMARYVNSQTISICEEHYYSESIGKIVKRVKELAH